jgi:hypothetical protein
LQLVDVVDFGGCYAFIVTVNGSLDESCAVVGFEASDNALVLQLDMCSKVWFEVFNSDVLNVGRDNVAGKVILKQKYFSILGRKFTIPLLNPVLVELSSHPSLRIMLVIKSQLGTCLLVECSWSCCFSDDECGEFLRSIGICCERIRQPKLFAFDT